MLSWLPTTQARYLLEELFIFCSSSFFSLSKFGKISASLTPVFGGWLWLMGFHYSSNVLQSRFVLWLRQYSEWGADMHSSSGNISVYMFSMCWAHSSISILHYFVCQYLQYCVYHRLDSHHNNDNNSLFCCMAIIWNTQRLKMPFSSHVRFMSKLLSNFGLLDQNRK